MLNSPFPFGMIGHPEPLEKRLSYLKDAISRYPYMIDTDYPDGNTKGVPFPEDVLPAKTFGQQVCYIPFPEKKKACWLFGSKEKAELFYETHGGTRRYT